MRVVCCLSKSMQKVILDCLKQRPHAENAFLCCLQYFISDVVIWKWFNLFLTVVVFERRT